LQHGHSQAALALSGSWGVGFERVPEKDSADLHLAHGDLWPPILLVAAQRAAEAAEVTSRPNLVLEEVVPVVPVATSS